MNIKYDFHKDKKLCCDKKNQFRARIEFIVGDIPFRITGCGKTRKEAKDNLIISIKGKPEWMKKAILRFYSLND